MKTAKDIDAMVSAIAGAIKGAIEGPRVHGRIAELEQRIKALEQRPLLKYAGVWRSGNSYAEGQLTTHQGGLWLSTDPTTSTPGTPGSGWRLIVKQGRA